MIMARESILEGKMLGKITHGKGVNNNK